MGTFDVLELVIEEATNIVIWLVCIIQGKSAMDGLEWLMAVERGDNIWFGTIDEKEFYW